MRGEHNKKWNKRVTRPCPVCGGRVIVANRNQSWWIRCDEDPFHIKYKPYRDPYSAIRAFNAQTNADRIRTMSDEKLAELIGDNIDCNICKEKHSADGCPRTAEKDCYGVWLDWLKSPVEVDNGT